MNQYNFLMELFIGQRKIVSEELRHIKIYKHPSFSNDYDFDIVTDPVFTPLNNDLLDYAAGWLMTLDVDVSNWTNCQVPLQGE